MAAGHLDTGLVERLAWAPPPVPDEVAIVAWLLALHRRSAPGPWGRTDGWRLGGPAWVWGEVAVDGRSVAVGVRAGHGSDGAPVQLGAVEVGPGPSNAAGHTWLVAPTDPHAPAAGRRSAAGGAGPVVSPMPGTVVAVVVSAGEAVVAGQPMAVVEAMKMEHTLTAPVNGVVEAVHAQVGEPVALRQPVVTVSVPGEGTP